MDLSSFFNREYYLPKTKRLMLSIPIGYGLIILFILLLFSPFGMHNIKTIPERVIVSFGYACITFVVWFGALKIFMLLKISRVRFFQILFFILSVQILTGVICTIYNNIIFSNPYYLEFILDFQFFVLLTGIIPTFMLMLFLETSFYKKQFLDKDTYHVRSSEKNGKIITIKDENPEKSIDLILSEIISINSMDNYIKIDVQRNGEKLKPIIIRSTLKNVEANICKYNCFIRCHRSHIINLNWVSEVTGNALAKKCIMQIGDSKIPISRSKVDFVLERIQKFNSGLITVRP